MSQNGITKGTRVVFDIDTLVFWQTFAAWCACQMINAVACIWPPDMRYRHIDKELEDASKNNGFPTPVLVRTYERLNSWLKNDRQNNIIGRKFLCISNIPCNPADTQFPSENIACFENAVGSSPAPALVDETAARLYSQGSHCDAHPIDLPYTHLQDQADDLKNQFDIDKNARIFIDLHTPHTVVLALFALCAQSGAVFCTKTPDFDTFECIHHDITHAFLLPSSIDSIRKKIQFPEKTSAAGKKWRRFCLQAGHFNAKHPTNPKWTRKLINSVCIHPLKNKAFNDLKSLISYGDHFDSKNAEFYTNLGLKVYNAYTVSEFGFVHVHEFMGKGGYFKSIEAKIKNGVLAVKSHRMPNFVNMNDLVFEDERCGLCTHRSCTVTLSSGTAVDVSPMREIIARNPVIDEIFIFGQNRPFLTAIIYLDCSALKTWAASQKIPDAPFAQLAQNPIVYKYILSIVENCNQRRSTFENIQKIAVIPKTLTEDPRILTPTGLTRRTTVEHRYASLLDAFYSNNY